MLEIAIAVLVIGFGYAIATAPASQRVTLAVMFVALVGAGYAVAVAVTEAGTDERTYYPIAGAIAGAMIGFAWVSKKRKQWAEARDRAATP